MSDQVTKEIELEIAHVLFIDIVGYSKLSINEQRVAVDELNEIVRGSEQFRKAEAAARLIKIPTGDGMALAFATTPEAPVQCALEISRALKSHPELRVRMGIHSGPVSGLSDVNDRANIAGAGINMAQRVMDCGNAGHILVSRRAAEDLEQYRRWQPCLHDLGECEVKHGVRVSVVNLYTEEFGNPALPEKFKTAQQTASPAPARRGFSLIALGIFFLLLTALAIPLLIFAPALLKSLSRRLTPASSSSPAAAATIAEKSIAVLPFENLSEEKANAYFADGIQDEILTRLSKIADLKVISRTSTQRYKSAPNDLREIAKQLGVANILEGSVQKSNEQVRITVQLINALNDLHLWAETYDRKLIDVFQVETDLAQKIATSLEAKLTGREKKEIAVRGTTNADAYDAFLHALALSNRQGTDDAENMVKFARRAVELDPNYAEAWFTLALAEAQKYFYPDHSEAQLARARTAAETAMRLAPDSAEGPAALGVFYYYCLREYDRALAQLELARSRAPNNANAMLSISLVKRRQGRIEEAIAIQEEAARLDPLNQDVWANLGRSYRGLRKFNEAHAMFERALAIDPNDLGTISQQAEVYTATGDLERAWKIMEPIKFPPTDRGFGTYLSLLFFQRRSEEHTSEL